MNNEMKLYIYNEYQEIYKKLYIDYMLGLKNLNEDSLHRGLSNSGASMQIIFDFEKKLINQSISEIEKLLNYVQTKFNRTISKTEIEEFINKSIVTTNQHLDNMYTELVEKTLNLAPSGTIELSFNNLRGNISNDLKKIEEKINLSNKGKKKDKNNLIGIISIIVAVIGIIITILLAI